MTFINVTKILKFHLAKNFSTAILLDRIALQQLVIHTRQAFATQEKRVKQATYKQRLN